jgi:deoxyhypusine synthase
VSVIVTTAGGIEEDLIKCLSPTFLTPDKSFGGIAGKELRSSGLNRIGNLIVPNQNYCQFEDWILPILDEMKLEQDTQAAKWSPSKVVERLGHKINHPDSFLYWAAQNKIPVFCPALTDGCQSTFPRASSPPPHFLILLLLLSLELNAPVSVSFFLLF